MRSSRQRIPETNVYYYKSPEHRFEKQELRTNMSPINLSQYYTQYNLSCHFPLRHLIDKFDKSLFSNNYVLSFAFAFDRDEEKYQFALAYPYSYSRCILVLPYSYSRC